MFPHIETFVIFVPLNIGLQMKYFETQFMKEAEEFIALLDPKTIQKLLYHIELAEHTNDSKLFKKIKHDIWEFRSSYNGLQIRLFAFWDKSNKQLTLVIACHGLIKKVAKIPAKEINKAIQLRLKYFNNKSTKNETKA